MGHVGSKTRSLGQILEKPSVPSKGHIFNLILMKFGQNVCLDEISDEFANGSYSVLYHIIRKPQVNDSRAIMALLFFIVSFREEKITKMPIHYLSFFEIGRCLYTTS